MNTQTALTSVFFGNKEREDVNLSISMKDFKTVKRVRICDLTPNQPHVDMDVVEMKQKGKGLTMPYVLEYNGKLILMDGHHTTIAKMLNGQQYIKCLYFKA